MNTQEVVQDPAMLTEDQVLALVQKKQISIVEDLTKGQAVPEDNSDRNMLMSALDSLSRNALSSKRIKVEEKTNAGMAGMAGLVSTFLNEVGKIRGKNHQDVVDIEIKPPPVLGSEVPEPVLVPGELDVNPKQITYDELMSQG
jgi:hypothetical protein